MTHKMSRDHAGRLCNNPKGKVVPSRASYYDSLNLVDVGVRRRDEGLGHEVVVVAHEELHGIVGEQRTQLVCELRSQHLADARDVA